MASVVGTEVGELIRHAQRSVLDAEARLGLAAEGILEARELEIANERIFGEALNERDEAQRSGVETIVDRGNDAKVDPIDTWTAVSLFRRSSTERAVHDQETMRRMIKGLPDPSEIIGSGPDGLKVLRPIMLAGHVAVANFGDELSYPERPSIVVGHLVSSRFLVGSVYGGVYMKMLITRTRQLTVSGEDKPAIKPADFEGDGQEEIDNDKLQHVVLISRTPCDSLPRFISTPEDAKTAFEPKSGDMSDLTPHEELALRRSGIIPMVVLGRGPAMVAAMRAQFNRAKTNAQKIKIIDAASSLGIEPFKPR